MRQRDDDDMDCTKKGKGCHLLPLVNKLFETKENWKEITDKKTISFW